MNPLINIATEAARVAGKLILKGFERPDLIKRTVKNEHDFTTDIDQKAEQAIIEIIHKAYPQHAILAEESGKIGEHDFTWIIDPLDGTRNFIHNYPHFAVSIAVQVDNKIEHGVIYDPIRDELFTASYGRGTQLNGRRLRLAERPLNQAIIALNYPTHNAADAIDMAKKMAMLAPVTGSIRKSGSAALDLAYLAAGRVDGYFCRHLSYWDYAAGVLMIQEAGGIVTDWQGREEYLQGQLLAAHPKLYKQLIKLLG